MEKITLKERIKLRDELIEEFKKLRIMYINSNNNVYNIIKNKLINELKNNSILKESYNQYVNQFRSEEEALYCIIHQDDFENYKCPICQKLRLFHISKRRKEYYQTCGSEECKKKRIGSNDAKAKRNKTKKERYNNEKYNNRSKAEKTCEREYGVKNPFQYELFKEKIKETNLDNLGVEYPFQSEEIKDKRKATKKERYNNENYNNPEKTKQTKFERYDDCCYNNSQKRKETCNDRYGVDNPFQYEPFKEKVKERNLREKGCEYSCQSEEVKAKIKTSLMIKKGIQYYSNISEVNRFLQKYNKLFKHNITIYDIYNNNQFFNIFIKKLYKYKNRLLKIKELCDIFGFTGEPIIRKLTQLNITQYCYIQDSNLEIQFKDFLEFIGLCKDKNKDLGFIRKERSILPINVNTFGHPEIDFYLHKYKIAFEINDIKGHNLKKKSQFYHAIKTFQCQQKNIYLIHIWEWELTDQNKWQKLSEWILNLLNNSKIQLNVNDCNIRVVSIEDEKEFINQYSLQAYKQSNISLGLYYQNNLIQLLSFIKDDSHWELSQIITKYGFNIKSGCKRILDYFISNYDPKYIISYCNLDKGDISLYEKLGFKLIQYNLPVPISANKNESSDYKRIYDCGQNVYILTRKE